MTYEHMIALFIKAGVNFKQFYKKSSKSLYQLYREIDEFGEIELVYDEKTHKLVRIGSSVKVLIETKTGYQLREIKREYPNGKVRYASDGTFCRFSQFLDEKVGAMEHWSISETMRPGENVAQTAARGLQEECGIDIDPLNPRQINTNENIGVSATPDEYDSKVYYGLRSRMSIWWAYVTLEDRPWTEDVKMVQEKDGTKIFFRWTNFVDQSQEP